MAFPTVSATFQIFWKLFPVHRLLLGWLVLNDSSKFVWSRISSHSNYRSSLFPCLLFLVSNGQATSIIMHDFILFRSAISGLLCSMWRSVWILKPHYSLYFSESLTGSGLWSYQFAVLSKPHFPLRSHWITWAISSWLYDLYFYSLTTYSACLRDILIVNKNARSSVESRLLWDKFCPQLVKLLFSLGIQSECYITY